MEILVLGGNGFIGTHLVDRLVSYGHSVSVFDISPNPFIKETQGVKYFYGKIQDIDEIRKSLKGIEVVFHLVSTTVPATSNQNMVFDIESNLVAMISILDLMREIGMKRIIYLSSGGTVYGNPITYPISEDHPMNPLSSYGVIKMTIEKYLLLYHNLYGFEPLIIRPANAYGERQNFNKKQGVTAHFLYNILKEKPMEVWGDGEIRRDYIYVGDLVNQMIKGLELGISGIFNAGAGIDHSLNDIINTIEDIIGEKLDVTYQEARSYDVEKVKLNIEKANKELSWKPEVSLKEGITRQYLWMKEIMS